MRPLVQLNTFFFFFFLHTHREKRLSRLPHILAWILSWMAFGGEYNNCYYQFCSKQFTWWGLYQEILNNLVFFQEIICFLSFFIFTNSLIYKCDEKKIIGKDSQQASNINVRSTLINFMSKDIIEVMHLSYCTYGHQRIQQDAASFPNKTDTSRTYLYHVHNTINYQHLKYN